jgi:hypothetical protein
MKIKQCLISFPLSVIGFICLLVGIVCWSNYLYNHQQKLALKQLTVSTALLQTITESEQGLNKIAANKLSRLKKFKKTAGDFNNYSQTASIFVLIGSLLLGVVFFYNLNRITSKLNKLYIEVENINKNGLNASNLNYSFDNKDNNEIDCLANTIGKVLTDAKDDGRKTNFILSLLREHNKRLKQQVESEGSHIFH